MFAAGLAVITTTHVLNYQGLYDNTIICQGIKYHYQLLYSCGILWEGEGEILSPPSPSKGRGGLVGWG